MAETFETEGMYHLEDGTRVPYTAIVSYDELGGGLYSTETTLTFDKRTSLMLEERDIDILNLGTKIREECVKPKWERHVGGT